MDNSIYIALSRQIGLFRDLNVTANNLANVNTTGYQSEKLMFTDYLVDDGKHHKMAFTQDLSSYRDTNPGSMRVTENALDMAIRGEGYFTVRTPQGDRYTRAGNFQLDGEGVMITAEGYPVLDAGGQEIQFDDTDREIRVLQTGAIVVDGEERAILGVVKFAKDQELEREGSTFYSSKQQPEPADPEEMQVLHGVIENSNVSPVLELVKLTELSRSTGSTAKMIETLYDLERKTSNTWTQQA
jgi:flagellar basal-body rod protein FlgF